MNKTLKIGRSDFRFIVENNGYFVDKTLFIEEFYNNPDNVLLIPRPRRFGKTLNLSMCQHFFDVTKKESAQLFKEFKIHALHEFCSIHQNKYPVINLSLKSIKSLTWDDCIVDIKKIIAELYQDFDFLLHSEKLKSFEKQKIESLIIEKASVNDLKYSLKDLCRFLYIHYEKEVIILIDEYDTPVIASYTGGYYKEIITFMRTFLGQAFKENNYLHKGLITGIMRIARESIFSEMNNVGVHTITNLSFADKFGFTNNETLKLLNYFNLDKKYNDVMHWYNGYTFGNTGQIYNPWSVLNYISRKEEGFRPYWVNTGTDPLIREKILVPDVDNTFNTLQKLIAGEEIEKNIDENFVFPDFEIKTELIWTLLVFSGYLTQIKNVHDDLYTLKVPNNEVKLVFKKIILYWFSVEHKIKRETLEITINHLLNNRLAEFETGFRSIMGDSFSYFDTASEPEKAYQSYVLGLLAIIGDDYIIKSNRESGEGRYDVMIIPHDKMKNGVVMEFKTLNVKSKDQEGILNELINNTLGKARLQIDKKRYCQELIDAGLPPEKILKVPVVFVGKVPYVNEVSR